MCPRNSGEAADPPLAAPPLLVIVALPAVEVLREYRNAKPRPTPLTAAAVVGDRRVAGSRGVEEFRDAAARPPPLTAPPLLVIVALPAVEVSKNSVRRRRTADCAAVVGDCRVAGSRGVGELREAAARTADCAAVVGDRRVAGRRGVEEMP